MIAAKCGKPCQLQALAKVYFVQLLSVLQVLEAVQVCAPRAFSPVISRALRRARSSELELGQQT